MTATIYETDSFSLGLDVKRQPENTAFNLTNATVEAVAESGDGILYPATCVIDGALTGSIRVSYPPATFPEGIYTLQVRVTLLGEVQTVLADYSITVLRSIGD